MNNISETVTENIFRLFYGPTTFIEKSTIPKYYKILSKENTGKDGYPDFFKDLNEFSIIVEAKALKHSAAEIEVKYYMENNEITKDQVGIAISGQHENRLKVSYFYKKENGKDIEQLQLKDKLVTLETLKKIIKKRKQGSTISDSELNKTIKKLNEKLHKDNKIRNTDRSLFFSGVMIALTNNNFRSTYKNVEAPTRDEISSTDGTVLEAHYLNEALIDAIDKQLKSKINNMSKSFNWKDKFSFIRNIDYSLVNYKEIIKLIENKVYSPFSNEEKQDILGKAYKVFLSRSGKAENSNIILTPDHIKSLMVKLAELNKDDVVIDTCTGSGGFLMESMEVLINIAKDDKDKIEEIKSNQLIGFENDSVLFTLACSNMFLHGDGRSNLMYRNSLLHSDFKSGILNNKDNDLFNYVKKMKPNKCIINPPYEKDSPIKFTLQALEYIENNGRLVIIMPTPTLTKHKNDLTKDLLEVASLKAVIKMPYALFTEQGRSVNTSIFVFDKKPHNYNQDVIFLNLKEDGFKSVQHKGRIDINNKWNDIENSVLQAVLNNEDILGKTQRKKIIKNENGQQFINPSGFQESDESKKMVKFKDLFEVKKGELQSSKNDIDGDYRFITASDEIKFHSVYTNDQEALIYAIAASGSLGKSQYYQGKFIASNLCLVLTPKSNSKYPINLQFYNILLNNLREKIVDDLADGTSKLTIKKDELLDYYIEYIDIEKQNKFVKDYIVEKEKLLKNLDSVNKRIENGILNLLEP
ncbi:N-6 DNA methylase [Staphylococcus nepalensis]